MHIEKNQIKNSFPLAVCTAWHISKHLITYCMCINRSISRTHLFIMHYRWLSSNYLHIAIGRLWWLLLWWYFELLFWWLCTTLKNFKVMLHPTYKSSLVLIYVLSIRIGRFLFAGLTLSKQQSISDSLKNILTYASYSLFIADQSA